MQNYTPLLELENVSIYYKTATDQVNAAVNVSLSLDRGDSLGIVGESGSGKSTLARGILRLLPNNAGISGSIRLEGTDLLQCSERELQKLRWQTLSAVFQNALSSFSPVHRIGEQILDIYRVHRPKATRQEAYARIKELFAIVNLTDKVLDQYPHQLSGGMIQRVCISLSLLFRPSLVIFDEATTALDVVTQGQVLEEIRRLESELGVTNILITHDVSVVAETCRKVAVMYAGYLMEVGSVDQVLKEPSHPYTQGLLESFPTLEGEKTRLQGIPGVIPDLRIVPDGCVFAPRCPMATELCLKETPPVYTNEQDVSIRCHYAGGGRQ